MEKSTYEDIRYEVDGPAAVITINREDRLNAFRGQTIEELIHAFKRGWADQEVRGELMPAAKAWVNQLAQYSPTAIRFLKHSFNADTDHQGGLSQMSQAGLDVFSVTDEAREGAAAFAEKRKPDFTTHQVTH